MTQFKVFVFVAVCMFTVSLGIPLGVIGISTSITASAAPKPAPEETISLDTLRQMLGDRAKMTTYQKSLLIEKMKKKVIIGEGVVYDVRKSLSSKDVYVIFQVDKTTIRLYLKKDMIERAGNLSKGQKIMFRGKIEQPAMTDESPTLKGGTFEIIKEEK